MILKKNLMVLINSIDDKDISEILFMIEFFKILENHYLSFGSSETKWISN